MRAERGCPNTPSGRHIWTEGVCETCGITDRAGAGHGWPKTSPSGHVYNAPTTYEELCRRHEDAGQGFAEGWDADELPPEPTWEMVGLAHRQIERLRWALRRACHDSFSDGDGAYDRYIEDATAALSGVAANSEPTTSLDRAIGPGTSL